MAFAILIIFVILSVSSSRVAASDLFEIGSAESVAGGGTGSSGSALAASMLPLWVAVGPNGIIYIADEQFNLIRSIADLDLLETAAGNGAFGFNGDELQALESSLSVPAGLDVDTAGRLHFVDLGNHSVRRVELDGSVVTLVDEDHPAMAQSPYRFSPASIGISQAGFIYIADRGNHMIWQLDPAGAVTAFAGSGERGFGGDGGQATAAKLADPRDVCVGTDGKVYIADFGNGRVRVVLQDGSNDLNIRPGNWWLANQQMADSLDFAGYDYRKVWGDGGHSLEHGGAIFPDTMRWLWRDYVSGS